MLKINKTQSSIRIIDELIFREMHNENSWSHASLTSQSQEDTLQRIRNNGVFKRFREEFLTEEFKKDYFKQINRFKSGYCCITLRECFYNFQKNISK